MNIQKETLDLLKSAQANAISNPLLGALNKSFRTDQPSSDPTSGPKFYNLDTVVAQLYPVEVPALGWIPRVKSKGGNAINFKQVTGVNPSGVFSGGVEGQRGAVIDHVWRDVTKKYVTSILENTVTWQSDFAGEGLTPGNRALAAVELLNGFRLDEHKLVLNARGTVPLGQTAAPVAIAEETAGASIAAGNYVVIACGLSDEGFRKSSLVSGVKLDYTSVNSVGGTTLVPGGHAIKSAASAAVAVDDGEALLVSVPNLNGAAGYAWFVGADAASARLTALTRGNTTTITLLNGASQLASAVPAADRSADPLRYDGVLTQIQEPGSNSIVTNMGGGTLTPTGSGGIVEFDEHLQKAWDDHKISYTRIACSGVQRRKVAQAIMGSPAGTGAARIIMEGGNNGTKGGAIVASYLNPITGRELELVTLPDLPDDCILFWSDRVDYSVPDSRNVIEMVMAADYFQIEFPFVNLSYDIGIATYGTLAVRYPPAFGLIVNADTNGR